MTNKKLRIPLIVIIAVLLLGIGGYITYSYVTSNKFNPDISDVAEVKTNEIDFSDQTENTNSDKPDSNEDADNLTDDKVERSLSESKNNRKGIYIDSQSNRFLINRNGGADTIGINAAINAAEQIPSADRSNTSNSGNSGENGSGGVFADGDSNVIFPAVGTPREPQKSTPKDAYDGLGIPIPEYKANDPDNNARIMTLEVTLAYDDMFDNDNISIYDGETLTQQNLLCRVYAYASDGTTTYRIKELSSNFYIKDYPEKAYNNFSATFCFRTTSLSPWQEVTLTVPTVARKLLLMTYDDGVYANASQRYSKLYPEYNEKINLYKFYSFLGDNGTKIDRLFRGWSETKNGKPIGETYTVKNNGLIYLYPSGFIPVPSGIEIQIQSRMFTNELEFLQTVTGCDGKIKKLDVPRYISFIQFSSLTELDEMNLSDTVKYFDADNADDKRTLKVKNKYSVNENNPYFTSVDGMLLSKDESVVYDIPSDTKSANIPKTVSKINLSEFNTALKEIHLNSSEVPSIDLLKISNATIYVPSKSYFDYLNALGSYLGTNRLLPDDNSAPEYIFINGAILSDYGKTLCSVDKNAIGTVVVPSSVENVASGATDNNPNIDTIIFDKNLKHLEKNAINADNIKRVFILSENAVDTEYNSFFSSAKENPTQVLINDLSVYVQSSAYDDSLTAWGSIFGDSTIKSILHSDSLSLENENGFELLGTLNGSIILNAPKDLEKFDSSTLTKPVYEIGACAFKKSEKLRYADLSDTVKVISIQAFAECQNLEGVYCAARDSITVKSRALYNDNSLKYGVFSAKSGNFAGDFQNINTQIFFAPYNTEGYGSDEAIDYFAYFVDYDKGNYEIVKQNDNERIVYAWCDYISDSGDGYVLCAATTGISGKIVLPDNTKLIQDYAFANCKNKFTLENYDKLELISSYSFANSGLSGNYDFTNLHFVLEGGFSSCKYLKNVKFPVLKMGTNIMMAGCSSLETVEFGDELESVWNASFGGCDRLKKISFSSETPISLEGTFGTDFVFADETSPDDAVFKIELKGKADPEEYVKQWRCTILGWPLEFADMISDDELARGETNARKYLGIYDSAEKLTETNTETPYITEKK